MFIRDIVSFVFHRHYTCQAKDQAELRGLKISRRAAVSFIRLLGDFIIICFYPIPQWWEPIGL